MAKIRLTFPPLNAEQEAKAKGLLANIEELMGVEIETSQLSIVQVEFDGARADVAQVVKRVITTIKNRPVIEDKK